MTDLTDNELLLLAAKAVGAKPYDWDTSGTGLFIMDGIPVILANGDHDEDWNPLADDGQALRLAVIMGRMDRQAINIVIDEPFDGDTDAYTWVEAGRFGEETYYHGDDPFAATRRAIVMIAAEIGKGMA